MQFQVLAVFSLAALIKATPLDLPGLPSLPLPTIIPTVLPTVLPTDLPTILPTVLPTDLPTILPTVLPTDLPTILPTVLPTDLPTILPTVLPTDLPTILPTVLPTDLPTILPTVLPTILPTLPPLLPASQCTTGPIQCCSSVQSSTSLGLGTLLASLGINVADITGLVGVTCSPLSIIGLPGNSCSAQPVCCSDNSFNGIVAIGCTPVNLNL